MIQIYIECSASSNYKILSGIQRAVLRIIESINEINYKNVSVVPVLFDGKEFVISENKKSYLVTRTLKKISFIHKLHQRLLKHTIYIKIIHHHLFKLRFLDRLFPNKNNYLSKKINHEYTDKHILILLDSSWNQNLLKSLTPLRKQGLLVTAVLYDLLPFQYPSYFLEITKQQYLNYWKNAVGCVDSIGCISDTVRDDFLECQKKGLFHKQAISPSKVFSFKLGDNFNSNDLLSEFISSDVPFFIAVGSVEPRKNHKFILDAFEEIWGRNIDVGLIIIANNTWLSDSLIKRIKKHSKFNSRLFLCINEINDRELSFIYQLANGLIAASVNEGYGLPIVEAMRLKVKIFCSDIKIFKEIAGDYPKYFDLHDASTLSALLIKEMNKTKLKNNNKVNKSLESTSWNDSYRNLINEVVRVNS
jgi:glycosyltransferase involved in cell wall biosynthesis